MFRRLHTPFSVTCQTVFCRLQIRRYDRSKVCATVNSYDVGRVRVMLMGTIPNTASPSRKFQLVAGDLCLDFANTVGGKRGATTREYLNSYADFVSWCEQAGLLDGPKAKALVRRGSSRPDDSAAALQRAVALRETIYRIFAALASH